MDAKHVLYIEDENSTRNRQFWPLPIPNATLPYIHDRPHIYSVHPSPHPKSIKTQYAHDSSPHSHPHTHRHHHHTNDHSQQCNPQRHELPSPTTPRDLPLPDRRMQSESAPSRPLPLRSLQVHPHRKIGPALFEVARVLPRSARGRPAGRAWEAEVCGVGVGGWRVVGEALLRVDGGGVLGRWGWLGWCRCGRGRGRWGQWYRFRAESGRAV